MSADKETDQTHPGEGDDLMDLLDKLILPGVLVSRPQEASKLTSALSDVVDAWPKLPEAARQEIGAIIARSVPK